MTVQPPPMVPPPTQPQKSSGCLKWGLIGCGAIIILGIGCVAAIVLFVFGAIKSSDVYRGARSRVESDPRVIEALGSPVEAGWWLSGNVNVQNRRGTADFTFPVHGPKSHGTVHAVAAKENDRWNYSELTMTPANGPPIDLLRP